MDKQKVWPLYIAIAISLLLSGLSAFSQQVNLENASFPLGVMSLLVTILIGFQIYNALGIQKEMQELNKRIDKFEEKSNKKIEALKSERGILKLSHSHIELNRKADKAYFTVSSNTKWNIYVNNSAKGQSINGLNVYPLNGEGNATITIEYESVESENYQQIASISVFYMSYGTEQSKTISVNRKHLPN